MSTSGGRIKGLGEVSIRVKDLEGMRRFYAEVLGLEVIRQLDDRVFFKVADGYGGHTQNLALFQAPDRSLGQPQAREFGPEGTTLHHIALNVALEDFAAETQRLEGLGLAVRAYDHGWLHVHSAYFSDPEGNTLELVCYDEAVQ